MPALLGGDLRAEAEGPVVEPVADDFGAELVGGGLQGCHVANRQKGVVIFAEADLGMTELVFNEAVAVEVVCCLEGEERTHAHDEGTEHFIVKVEMVMC